MSNIQRGFMREKIRVGICLETEGENGGIHQYTLGLLDALGKLPSDRYEVVGICLSDAWYSFCVQKGIMCYKTMNTINQVEKIRRFFLVYLCGLNKKKIYQKDFLDCKANKVDICFFTAVSMHSYYNSVDRICAIHDMNHRIERQDPEVGNFYTFVTRDILYRNIVKSSKIILADSQVGKMQIEEAYKKDITGEICVLPFVAPDYIYNGEELEPSLDWQQICSCLPKRYFFYPAQLWIHKNHISIIKAMHALKRDYPEIHIVFAGADKNASAKVRSAIKELQLEENITLLGYVSNYSMIQLYKNAVALIMASYHGPTNIPQLEAFYIGCPVAIANVYATKEQVGEAALLFPPFDIDVLAECMRKLWTDDELRNELIAKGKERARRWGPAQFYERLLAIIESIKPDGGI